MNEIEYIQSLAARAGEPALGRPEVVDGVLARIRASEQESDLWPLAAIAGGSAVAACIVAAYALRSWAAYGEPVGDLLASFSMVMQ